jgi:transposase
MLQVVLMPREPYPTDCSDEEWAFVAPYLALVREDAAQRKYALREAFNAARWMVRAGAGWRLLPNDFPPWAAVYQQVQRWLAAGVFEAMVHDLRALVRMCEGKAPTPRGVVLDARTLQSTVESGARAGYDGHKRKKGSKLHMLVDTLGQLLAAAVTPASTNERAAVAALAEEVQQLTGDAVEVAFVDQGYTGRAVAADAARHGIQLEVVGLPEAKRGFVLLPRRWVVERSFAWLSRFRRLARDYERLPETLRGMHFLAFACLMLKNVARLAASA